VNSLPKTVTRQRRDCDLNNPGPSALESSTLTTRLRSHLLASPSNDSFVLYKSLACRHHVCRVVDSLQECCHCNDMSVVITSIDLVNDLLTSLDQLVTSDVPVLNVDPSPTDATPTEADIGIISSSSVVVCCSLRLPSVLCRCWLGGRKGIRTVVGCWHGYLSGARCRLACGPSDAAATHCLLLQ